MFNLPYETRAASGHVLGDVVSALQQAFINNELAVVRSSKDVPIEGLYQVPPYLKAIPPFGHPIQIQTSDKTILVIDTRAFTREDRANNALKVTIPGEYEQLYLYGRLTQAWLNNHQSDLSAVGEIVPRVFANLISQNIVRRLGLNPQDQQALTVVSTYYYFCLFMHDQSIAEQQLLKVAARISQVTSITGTDVLRILKYFDADASGQYKVLQNLEDFVEGLKGTGTSPRLSTLNVGFVITAIGGVWFGANARENVAVSLEYPPLFITLVYKALMDRSYHGTMLSRFVEISNRRDAGKDFTRNLANFLEMTAHA
jgi:hypothetical protein